MRPLILKMSAFGSYAGTQTIEFTELKGRTFFLIHGPTGAGKTTILDAICFSLYGDASNEHRDSKSLRSNHAAATACTEVTFDFAVGQDLYRIQRIPEQMRLKRRGEGTTVQTAEAALWKLAADGSTELVTTGWSKVTESIEHILGFKSDQFRQVVLLPQGEFRKLLLADSKDRQEIMQVLFKTELYRAVEEMLRGKAQELKQQFEALHKEINWICQEADVQSLTELQNRHERCGEQLQETGRKIAQQGDLLSQAQAALTRGTVDQARLKEQQAARQALAQLEAGMDAINEQRAEWLRASRAAGLTDTETALVRLEQDVHAILDQQHDYEQKLALAHTELQEAQLSLSSEKSRETEREALAREIMQLNSIAERTAATEEAQANLQVCAGELAVASQLKQEAAARYADLRQNVQAGQEEYQKLLSLSLTENNLKYQYEQAQQMVIKRQRLEELRVQHQRLATHYDVLAARVKERQDEYSVISSRCHELQKALLAGQAAVLAAGLTEDMPCPVCGSRAHPQKAAATGTIPTEEQLTRQRQLLDEKDQECRRNADELGKCKTERDTTAHKLLDTEQQLGELADRSGAELKQVLQNSQRQLDDARDAQKRLSAWEQALSHLQEQTEMCAKQVDQGEERYRAAQSAYKTAEALLADRQALIPEAYRDAGGLAQARQAAEEKLSLLKQQQAEAQQRLEAAVIQFSTGEEAYRQTAAAYTAGRERLAEEQALFMERLQAAGFLTRQAYEQARKSAGYLQALEERLKTFDHTLAAAQERVRRSDVEAQDIQPPDMENLQQVLNKIREQYELALKAQTVLENTVKQQTGWLEKSIRLQAERERVEADYRIVGRLADAANGRNDYGLTFQRFVLGALLDDVATAANERLKLMSRGRYYLQRTMDRARKNAAGGLELEIFDNYTGNTRSVNTLSGGETFLASLALALGLADVVQAYTGGMHLDTIFIDEGFGTLDPESLDFAMQALLDLQRGGRLVGIISHVPELRERIDARLEIKATDKGSTAHFCVG